MKSLLLMAAMIVGLAGALCADAAPAYTLRVDGAWFDTDCYGCKGDTVIEEVKQQMADFKKADEAWEADHSTDNLRDCIKLALFSFDKAGYLLELGRLTGQSKYYKQAAAAAQIAIDMKPNDKFVNGRGENMPNKSHIYGTKWLAVAQKHLPKAAPAPAEDSTTDK